MSFEKVTIGPHTLYRGDCLEVLSSLDAASVDAIVTDPPYCSGGSLEAQKNVKGQGLRTKTINHDGFTWFSADNMSTAGLVALVRTALVLSRSFLKPNRSAVIFMDWRMVPNVVPALESSGLRYRNLLVWDKGSAGLGCGFKPAHEMAAEFCNGATEYASRTGQNVLRVRRVPNGEREHGAQKPVAMLGSIVEVIAKEGWVVLDPFMGSGSTGVACAKLGRQFVGCELSPEYFDIACKRIEDALHSEPLLAEAG